MGLRFRVYSCGAFGTLTTLSFLGGPVHFRSVAYMLGAKHAKAKFTRTWQVCEVLRR